MAKKKTEKSITLDDLAVMVNNGFQSMRDEMNERFEKVDERFEKIDERFENLEKEMREGFDLVNMKIERVVRKDDQQESAVLELKSRVKVIEKKLGIRSPR